MTDPAPTLDLLLDLPPGANKRLAPAASVRFVAQKLGGRMLVRSKVVPRLVKRKEARAWARTAEWEVLAQRKGQSIQGRCRALVLLPVSGFDADAPVKELFDALQHGGAVANDRDIWPYSVGKDPSLPPRKVRVLLWREPEP